MLKDKPLVLYKSDNTTKKGKVPSPEAVDKMHEEWLENKKKRESGFTKIDLKDYMDGELR